MRAHPEHAVRSERIAAAWEAEQAAANAAARAFARRLVPADITRSSASGVAAALRAAHACGELATADRDAPPPHASAAAAPVVDEQLAALARRIWERKALWLVHAERAQIAKTHIADLTNKYVSVDVVRPDRRFSRHRSAESLRCREPTSRRVRASRHDKLRAMTKPRRVPPSFFARCFFTPSRPPLARALLRRAPVSRAVSSRVSFTRCFVARRFHALFRRASVPR